MENENHSILLSNFDRSLASVSGDKAQADEVFKRLGIMDSQGTYVDDGALEEKEQRKAAKTEQLQMALDTKKPKPEAKPGEEKPVGEAPNEMPPDKNDMAGEGMAAAGKAVVKGVKAVGGMIKEQASNDIKPKDMLGEQIMGGIASGAENLVNVGIQAANWFESKFGKDWIPDDYQVKYADKFFPKSDLESARLARGVSQFLVPFSAVKKIAGGLKSANAIAGVAADFLAFPGKEERLSNLVQQVPELANPVTEWLQASPDDTDAEGRVKSTLEGLGLGVAIDGIMHALKFGKASGQLEQQMKAFEDMQMGKPDAEKLKADFGATGEGGRVKLTPMENPKDVVKPRPLVLMNSRGRKGLPNLKTMDESPDVLSVIQNVAEKDRKLLEPEIAVDATHAEIKNQPLTPVKDLVSKPIDHVFTAHELYSARVYRSAAARSVKALSLLDEGKEADYAFIQALEGLRQMSFMVEHGKNRYGVGLNSLKIKVSGEEGLPYMDQILKMHGEKEVSTMRAMMRDMPEEKISQAAQSSGKKRLFDAVFEGYINNLFTAKTHVVNFTSNFAVAQSSMVERWIAKHMPGYKETVAADVQKLWTEQQALLKTDRSSLKTLDDLMQHQGKIDANNKKLRDMMMSGVESGEVKSMAEAEAAETINQVVSSYTSIFETVAGISRAVKNGDGKSLVDIVKGSPNLDPFTKVEGTPHAISSENLGGGAFIDIVGGIARLNTRGLEWADNVWKAVNYRMEVNALANRMATKMGLTDAAQRADFIKEFTTNPPDFVAAPGQWELKNGEYQMIQQPGIAVEAARKRTFTNPIDTEWGNAINNLAKVKILDTQPLRFILPFTRTPLNISKYALDRTPLAMLGEEYKAAIAKGGAEAQMARAQVAFGTTILGTVGLLAGAGMITGSGPREPNARKLWLDSGEVPYSLKAGNHRIPLDKLEPIGSIISLAVDLSEISASAGRSFIGLGDDDVAQLGSLMAYSLVKHLTPEMIIDKMGELFTAIQDGGLPAMAADILPKTIPILGGELQSVRKLVDDKKRNVMVSKNDPFPWLQSIVNNFKNKIPGLSNTLPPLKNIWGDDVEYPHGIADDVISPFWGMKLADDPVTKELLRLGYVGQLAKKKAPEGESFLEVTLPPKKLSGIRGIPHGSVDLDAKQWTRFIELSAGKGLKYKGGVTLKEALNELVQKDFYKKFEDQQQRKFIKETINDYRKAAAVQMIQEDSKLEKKMLETQKIYVEKRGLRDEPE